MRAARLSVVSAKRPFVAGLLVVLLALGGVVGGVAPAALADGGPGDYLQIDKSVDKPTPQPGETFTYQVKVTCSEQDCLDAQLTDAFPAGLVGFDVESVRFTPDTTPYAVTWTGGSSTPPAKIAAGTAVAVDIKETTGTPVGVGMSAGTTFSMLVSLRVPDNYPPGQSGDIVNTAKVTATNANPVDSSAKINITVPENIGVGVTKAWSPNRQSYAPGTASSIALGVSNASNVNVDKLVLQEPKTAVDGSSALDASNPFTITDFTGFQNVSLPSSCTSVQVDAYVFEGGSWAWKTGPPAATPTLPNGVTNAQVGGIRLTCVGTITPGDTVSFGLGLAQRSTQRDTGADLSTAEHRVDNVANGTATAGSRTATKDAAASYTVAPSMPTVQTAKNIEPGQITAGQKASSSLSATNGAVPVSELRLADLDFFTTDVAFGGFTSAPLWPAGAGAAKVVYHLAAGGTHEVPFADGDVPAAPGAPVTGFELVFTGSLIQANAIANAVFSIDTTENATGGTPSVTLTNTVVSTVTAPNGLTAKATDDATLAIIDPSVSVTIDKTVRPGAPVAPGDSVIASLQTVASATGDGARINDIVVEDAWNGAQGAFWNAFTFTSVAPTQVPANATLTAQVRTHDGTWVTLATAPAQSQAFVFQMDAAATAAALAPLSPADVEGIRFTFHSDAGFADTTNVTPNVVFDARADRRTGGATTPGPDVPTTYTNTAVSSVTGKSDGGKTLVDDATDTAPGTIQSEQNPPGPGPDIQKRWTRDFLDAQSGQRADTTLRWNVSSGFAPVTITDPATDAGTPKSTAYDAFDLVSVAPIAPSSEPYSNGWYLKYETVTAVELFFDGTWHTVAAPGGSWMTANRGFAGYTLTADESAKTTGIRLVLDETGTDTAARQAARQTGPAFDPFAPAPGSGVGSGSVQREFDLTWQLRDMTRSTGTPITADSLLNTSTKGIVDNAVQISSRPLAGGADVVDGDHDTIQILNQPPGVKVTKSATPTTQIFTPVAGTSAQNYPTAQWTMTAHNDATAKASALRMTDPATCSQTALAGCQSDVSAAYSDPFDTTKNYLTDAGTPTPFDRFDATKITIAASIPAQIDATGSVVWLLHYAGGAYTTTSHTIAQVNALTAGELADVVGVSVTFRGVSAANTGTIDQSNVFTVTIDSRLRPTLRSTGKTQVLPAGKTADVSNRVFAQSYDPVLSPTTKTGDVADAKVVLTGGVVNITPTKSVNPASIAEPAKTTPVTVTLGANQGSNPRSTLSPNVVVIEDQADATAFWNTFDLTGLGAVTLPAGADRVRVDVHTGGASGSWTLGTAAATAALPAGTDVGAVDGIRFTFSRADDGLFSNTLPAASWSASAAFTVKVRDTYRDASGPVTFDHTVTNTQSSQSTRVDGNDSALEQASAQIVLTQGTHQIAVNKLSNNGGRLVSVGSPVPFDLTFQNTGTGFLTVSELTDTLPAQLNYLATPAPVFTKQADGLLSDKVTVGLSPDGRTVTFTWPSDGNRMKPGEVFKVRLYLELQPGLSQGDRATNTMTVKTAEQLTACRNTVQGGSTTSAFANDPTTCGTTDYVGVVAGSNLYTVKGVAGSLPGAYQPGSSDAICQQNLVVGSKGYFRAPCVANSEVDGTDDWVLHNVNAGTVPVAEMTVFDQLPTSGDTLLISGSGRGSTLRPELVADSLKVAAPAGTTQTVEVTTSTGVCVNTWSTLTTAPVCEQNRESWAAVSDSTDWSKVTGIRVHLDFRTTPAKALTPGQAADVTFSTVNRLAGADRPDGASATVPAADQFAWNQYGVKYELTTESTFRKIAPAAVGSHLRFGSIAVTKKITGPAATYAPASFLADVVCTAGGSALDVGAASTVTLSAANDYTARIDGIPLSSAGTVCTVTEQGAVGTFGETSRSGSPTTIAVTEAAPQEGGAGDVPASQIATLTNDYQFTGLSVTKQVQTDATAGQFGPFTFSLTCTSATGTPVVFDDQGTKELTFTLEAGQTWTAPADRIPARASCTVTETDSFFANHIVFTGTNVVDAGDGSATVTPGVDAAAVTVTNGYDAGRLTVGKVVTGVGADLYGGGSFDFSAVCTYQGQNLLDQRFSLRNGDTETFGVYPTGTLCAVKELTTGGATDATLDPADGNVTIVAPTDPAGIGDVKVTATNRFDLASFDVVKEREGNMLNPGAAGPFTVSAVCTYVVDGTVTDIAVPGGAERQLTAANDYRAAYTDLPVGATCEVTETVTGHAASTTVTVDTSDPVVGTTATIDLQGGDEPQLMTIANTFTAGQISVTKTVSGTAASAHTGDTFGVTLVCTWYGEDLRIPGGAVRDLTVGTPVVYTDLPTDAACVLTETRTGDAKQVTMTVDGGHSANPASVVIGTDTTIAIGVDNRFDKPLPATGGSSALVLAVSGFGIAGLIVGIVLLTRRRRREV